MSIKSTLTKQPLTWRCMVSLVLVDNYHLWTPLISKCLWDCKTKSNRIKASGKDLYRLSRISFCKRERLLIIKLIYFKRKLIRLIIIFIMLWLTSFLNSNPKTRARTIIFSTIFRELRQWCRICLKRRKKKKTRSKRNLKLKAPGGLVHLVQERV